MEKFCAQRFEFFIILKASTCLRQILLLDEHRRAFAANREAKLVVRPVLYRLFLDPYIDTAVSPHTFHCSEMLPGSIGPTSTDFFFSCSIFRSSFVIIVSFNTDSYYIAIGIKAQIRTDGKPIGQKKYQLSLNTYALAGGLPSRTTGHTGPHPAVRLIKEDQEPSTDNPSDFKQAFS